MVGRGAPEKDAIASGGGHLEVDAGGDEGSHAGLRQAEPPRDVADGVRGALAAADRRRTSATIRRMRKGVLGRTMRETSASGAPGLRPRRHTS